MANIVQGGFLSGKKTYIVMIMGVLGAVASYLMGDLTLMEAFPIILGSLGLGTLRAGIAKK